MIFEREKPEQNIEHSQFPQKTRRKLIYRTIKRYRDTGSTSDRQRSGRPTSATTTQKRKVIRSRIQRNPQRSMRKMALELNISRESVRTIVKSDLGLFPYKKRKVHFISAQIKIKRLARSKALLARFASFGLDEILFSDEKLFTVEQAYNRQNDRILSSSLSSIPQEYRCVQRVQHPQSVMVWAGVSAKGRTPLVFIPPGVKVNVVKYQELVLNPIVRGLGKTMFNDRPFYSSNTVRQPTQRKSTKSGYERISQTSSPRRNGLLPAQISIRWTSRCGRYWRQMRALLPTRVSSL